PWDIRVPIGRTTTACAAHRSPELRTQQSAATVPEKRPDGTSPRIDTGVPNRAGPERALTFQQPTVNGQGALHLPLNGARREARYLSAETIQWQAARPQGYWLTRHDAGRFLFCKNHLGFQLRGVFHHGDDFPFPHELTHPLREARGGDRSRNRRA